MEQSESLSQWRRVQDRSWNWNVQYMTRQGFLNTATKTCWSSACQPNCLHIDLIGIFQQDRNKTSTNIRSQDEKHTDQFQSLFSTKGVDRAMRSSSLLTQSERLLPRAWQTDHAKYRRDRDLHCTSKACSQCHSGEDRFGTSTRTRPDTYCRVLNHESKSRI